MNRFTQAVLLSASTLRMVPHILYYLTHRKRIDADLMKCQDGKGTVVVPFNYYYIEELTYDWFRAYPDDYDIFYGEWEDPDKGKDLIVDGQIVVKNASFTGGIDDRIYRGGITYQKEGKYGFLGIYWDWCLLDPIFDNILPHEQPPALTFVKNGTEGILTMDKEFIPTEKWDHMTDEEQDELMANGIGYENYGEVIAVDPTK